MRQCVCDTGEQSGAQQRTIVFLHTKDDSREQGEVSGNSGSSRAASNTSCKTTNTRAAAHDHVGGSCGGRGRGKTSTVGESQCLTSQYELLWVVRGPLKSQRWCRACKDMKTGRTTSVGDPSKDKICRFLTNTRTFRDCSSIH